MVKPMYVGHAEFSHPSWLPSGYRHATTGRHIAAPDHPRVYRWRPHANHTGAWYPDDKLPIVLLRRTATHSSCCDPSKPPRPASRTVRAAPHSPEAAGTAAVRRVAARRARLPRSVEYA
jgi:hypothetical protein